MGPAGIKHCLKRQGIHRAHLVHQGVDTAVFNAEPVPRLLRRSLVIFRVASWKIEKDKTLLLQHFVRCCVIILMRC